MASSQTVQNSDPLALAALDADTSDPPPPYPAHRTRRTRRRRSSHSQFPSNESQDCEGSVGIDFPGAVEDGYENVNENTPLLRPGYASPTALSRPRTISHSSTLLSTTNTTRSREPSLAQTVFSFGFGGDDDDDDSEDISSAPPYQRSETDYDSPISELPPQGSIPARRRRWRRYWRPVTIKAYWLALLHLLLINFPWTVLVWVYLFVFTLTGTTLLIALPLGAVLCFFDILGARAFSRAELYLQTKFHAPLPYPPPYPPHPIFTRVLTTPSDLPDPESALLAGRGATQGPLYDRSFYRNTYAMFTDPTSYRALFYFLVIKSALTLLLSICLVVLVPLGFAFVLTVPFTLRCVRKVGRWQAGVAVEGLYMIP